jgi:hypothetical protein
VTGVAGNVLGGGEAFVEVKLTPNLIIARVSRSAPGICAGSGAKTVLARARNAAMSSSARTLPASNPAMAAVKRVLPASARSVFIFASWNRPVVLKRRPRAKIE